MDRLNMRLSPEIALKYANYWKDDLNIWWSWVKTENGGYELSAFDELVDNIDENQIPCPTYGEVLEYLKRKGYGIRTNAVSVLNDDNVWRSTMDRHIDFQMSKILR